MSCRLLPTPGAEVELTSAGSHCRGGAVHRLVATGDCPLIPLFCRVEITFIASNRVCTDTRTMLEIRTILVPTDFSEPALPATRYGLELARRFGASLHLLHVIEDPMIYLPMFESYPLPSRDDFESFAQTRLDNWILPEDGQGVSIHRRWRHGVPFTEIVLDAVDCKADLIVVGTHGRGIAAHLLMGSVAEKVVQKAPCPVLTVRPEGHQFVHPIAGV